MKKQTAKNKKNWVWAMVAIASVLSAIWLGYWFFHKSPLVIESASLTTFDIYSYSDMALSPDGTRVYDGLRSYYLLEDNSWHENTAGDDWINTASQFTSISPTGRFMTAADYSKIYLLDMERNTYRDDAFVCKSWSSDGLRCIDITGRLVDILENKKIENWDNKVDFSQITHVSGNGDYLWDEDRKIPIAFLVPCPLRDQKTGEIYKTACELRSLSKRFDQTADGYTKPFLQVQGYDMVVDWTFSPDGKYILVAIWEQTPHLYTGLKDFSNANFVTDTRLELIDWRTGKTFVLARLSQFVPESPISVYFGDMQWSADGSTILIPLEKKEPQYLVLKVKYP